jgi:hypothetical protein
VEQIIYRAGTVYFPLNATFLDAYYSVQQACTDLYQADSPECKTTAAAMQATGMNLPSRCDDPDGGWVPGCRRNCSINGSGCVTFGYGTQPICPSCDGNTVVTPTCYGPYGPIRIARSTCPSPKSTCSLGKCLYSAQIGIETHIKGPGPLGITPAISAPVSRTE